MGGIGSGRPTEVLNTTHDTTHECDVLDIADVRRACRPFSVPRTHIETNLGTFYLTWTPCNYGGERPWLVCPGCRRRVGKLFGPRLSLRRGWACRHCHSLRYESQVERPVFPALTRVAGTKARLGEGAFTPVHKIKRPRRMHRSTYKRLLAEAEAAEHAHKIAFDRFCRATLEWCEKAQAKRLNETD
jgi:hypothetical protein